MDTDLYRADVGKPRHLYAGKQSGTGLRVEQSKLEPLRFAFLLLVTWICVRIRKEKLSSIGFVLGRCWARELGIGAFLGIATALLAVLMIWLVGGVRFELDPARSIGMVAYGAYMFLLVAHSKKLCFAASSSND